MSEKVQKNFALSEDDIRIINEVKECAGYRTEVAALRHIIQAYKGDMNQEEQNKQIAAHILNGFSKEYKEYWKRLYSSVRASDKTTKVLLDVLNTMLMESDYTQCIPVDLYKSPVIQESEELLKKKIGKNKQKKDRIRRRQES